MWLLLEGDDGWQIVVPERDSKPHATLILIDGENKEADLAGWECPCKPKVEWKDKIIVHNSFQKTDEKN